MVNNNRYSNIPGNHRTNVEFGLVMVTSKRHTNKVSDKQASGACDVTKLLSVTLRV